jgi:hypothetical protein
MRVAQRRDLGVPIPIIADIPRNDPGLGFEDYAKAIAAAVRGGTPAQFTVGIYGPWGSGKSSLLNAISRQLKQDPYVLTVDFDAWRHEGERHIVLPLLHAIYSSGEDFGDRPLAAKLKQALLSIARSLSFRVGVVNIDLSKISEPDRSDGGISSLNEAYSQPFYDMEAISEALGDRRIAVLVDDLDRCSPANVVALLEAINLVMDVPGFVFVLALDYDVLVRAVEMKYPQASSGHVFIEKMVQVPFRVPRLELKEETFLSDLIPQWENHVADFPQGFPSFAFDIAELALLGNPRQIKRLVNSLLVLLRVAKNRRLKPDPALLAGIVGLQLRWPEEYQDLVNAVLSEDEQPTLSLHEDADNQELKRYAERFLPVQMGSERLRDALLLTETVSTTESALSGARKLSAPAEELRSQSKQAITKALLREGFRAADRDRTVYVRTSKPGIRFKLEKTVLRFEELRQEGSGKWNLVQSFTLTRGTEEAVEFVRSMIEDRGAASHRAPD